MAAKKKAKRPVGPIEVVAREFGVYRAHRRRVGTRFFFRDKDVEIPPWCCTVEEAEAEGLIAKPRAKRDKKAHQLSEKELAGLAQGPQAARGGAQAEVEPDVEDDDVDFEVDTGEGGGDA